MTTGRGSQAACFWIETERGLILAVKAHPGARRVQMGPVIGAQEALGWPKARLKIAITEAAEAGRANEAIAQALAKWLRIKPARLAQAAGTTTRDKKFLVIDARAGDFHRQFADLSGLKKIS